MTDARREVRMPPTPSTNLILAHNRAVGDVVTMTGVVRDLALTFPGRYRVAVDTTCKDVWAHNPHVVPLPPPGQRKGWARHQLSYGDALKVVSRTPRHFLTAWHDDLFKRTGIRVPVRLPRPDLHLGPAEQEPLVGGRYWVVVAGGKSDFTTKWPVVDHVQTAVDVLGGLGVRFVQAGARGTQPAHWHPKLRGVTDLIGKTTLRDFVRLIAHADGVLCTITSAMHIAAAFEKPCVPGDTLTTTASGLTMVRNLRAVPFGAAVDGSPFLAPEGFWISGVKPVWTVTMKYGHQLRATAEHKVLTADGWKAVNRLRQGDVLVIQDHRKLNPNVDARSADYARGYCLGNFLADGSVHQASALMSWFGKDRNAYRADGVTLLRAAGWLSTHRPTSAARCSVKTELKSSLLYKFARSRGCLDGGVKQLSREALVGSWSYLAGLVAGYFDADGTVSVGRKGASVRIWSTQANNLSLLQIALNALGVFSKVYWNRLKPGTRQFRERINGQTREYECLAGHELVITRNAIERFAKVVPVRNRDKDARIQRILSGRKRKPNGTSFHDEVISVHQGPASEVFDCSVPGPDAFDADSLYAHNCVVWAGGREQPHWEAYVNAFPGAFGPAAPPVRVEHRYLHTTDLLPCCQGTAHCWKNKTTSDGKDRSVCSLPVVAAGGQTVPRCQLLITPEKIIEAVVAYHADGTLPPL